MGDFNFEAGILGNNTGKYNILGFKYIFRKILQEYIIKSLKALNNSGFNTMNCRTNIEYQFRFQTSLLELEAAKLDFILSYIQNI